MKHFVPILGLLFFLSACVRNNPQPVWISLDQWTLQPNVNMQNPPEALSHNFSDVWLYVDNKIIGVFELPCKIPVLTTGKKKIQIFPAIRNNGISATKKIYPFCQPVELELDLVAGNTYPIELKTRYYDNVKCWQENFSSNTIAISNDQSSTASISVQSDPAIAQHPGDGYGQIHLTADNALWIGTTIDDMVVPKGKDAYLEIDYRNSNSMTTGILAFSSSGIKNNPLISLNPQKTEEMKWKKIYIDLKEIVSASVSANYFRMYFQAQLTGGNSSADIYIDNVNVVHL